MISTDQDVERDIVEYYRRNGLCQGLTKSRIGKQIDRTPDRVERVLRSSSSFRSSVTFVGRDESIKIVRWFYRWRNEAKDESEAFKVF